MTNEIESGADNFPDEETGPKEEEATPRAIRAYWGLPSHRNQAGRRLAPPGLKAWRMAVVALLAGAGV